jgi:DNA replication protein DnaC
MLTGTALLNGIEDELNEMKLSHMASRLDELYHSPDFLRKDHMTILSEMIGAEYDERSCKALNRRLRSAQLAGSPELLEKCVDSAEREYLPAGITPMLASLDFIPKGYNICILGASDVGKSYFARALGIQACNSSTAGYFHSEELLENMVSLKTRDYEKFSKRMKRLLKLDLVILDDFLLHTITDEREVKILFELLEKRNEQNQSTIVCSQRDPESWKAMILNDEVSANSILKRVTRHYTVVIKTKSK